MASPIGSSTSNSARVDLNRKHEEIKEKITELGALQSRTKTCAIILIVSLALTLLTPSTYPIVITALAIFTLVTIVPTLIFGIKSILLQREVETPSNQLILLGDTIGKIGEGVVGLTG